MKKIIYILTCFTLLCSCSAEKRLAHLLKNHPELHRDSPYIIDKTIIHEEDTASTNFTCEELLEKLKELQNKNTAALGDSVANPIDANNSTPGNEALVRAENNGSIATITPNADGSLKLNVITKADTIHIQDTIPVPTYYTEYKDKIVYKMNNAQTFFFGLGILFLVLIAIFVIIKAVKHFI